MNELALFAGAGGGILGGTLLGWRTVCAVEIDPYCRSVLLARQDDGTLPPFPIWDNVCTFDGKAWRGLADVVSGGFPCQDISAAGKGAGIEGKRSGLWGEMARIVGEVLPRFVFVENSPLLVGRGLAVVLGDLAEMGYDAQWGVVGAHHAGAPHKRDRIWIVGHSNSQGEPIGSEQAEMERMPKSMAAADRLDRRTRANGGTQSCREEWWVAESDVGRVAYGVANRVDRLKALGNGQVPAVAALAWRILTKHGDYEDDRH